MISLYRRFLISKLYIWKALLLVVPILYSTSLFSQEFASGPKKVPLIELYTSEGCSSCPPAEQWLNSFIDQQSLWQEFVPIAFHVDYWDYIGWKDPFASAEYSNRQRRYKKEGNISGVYTPGFVFMGNEWRSWYFNKMVPKVEWSEVGVLNVKIKGKKALVKFSSSELNLTKLKANFSILGFDLSTKVLRGENKGKLLTHHFVNLAHISSITRGEKNQFLWEIPIPEYQVPNTSHLSSEQVRLAYAVWVSPANRLQPIQSTGAWIKKYQ